MKTKTRTSAVPRPVGTVRNFKYWRAVSGTTDGVSPKSEGSTKYSSSTSVETITYEQPFGKYYGNCTHTRQSWTTFPCEINRTVRFQGYPAGGADGYRIVQLDPYYLSLWCSTNSVFQSSPVIRTVDWAGMGSEAMDSMLPTFSERQESLVNTLLEFRQIGQLLNLWNTKISAVKNTTNLHLNVSFGWIPFLSDCDRIASALSSFHKKLRKLESEANTVQVHHYRRASDTIDLPASVTKSASLGLSFSSATTSNIYSWKTKPLYCATVKYKFVLPDMASLQNQCRAFLDHLGVQRNAAILWNALPYSFVIDWFVNVSGWLHSLRTDNLRISCEILGFCHSFKYEYSAETIVDLKFQGVAPAAPVYYTGLRPVESLVSYYERRRDFPPVGRFNSTTKGLNWSKFLLGASLISQRL